MRKLIITGVSVVALAVPTVAMAAAPDGSFNLKANDGARSENASPIGELSSQIKQNGQHVSATGRRPTIRRPPRARVPPPCRTPSATSRKPGFSTLELSSPGGS